MHPLCSDCLKVKRVVPATDVHHIAKVADAPDKRLDLDNLMSLCHSCHSVRTARGE
jgi:5-methylcytosine-specific restriction protein A